MTASPTTVDEWLDALLTGDATLSGLVGGRIYSYQAPEGAALPFVVWSHQGGPDVQGVGTARIMASLLVQVKAIDVGGSFATAKPIADRLDALLQGASGTATDGAVLAVQRQQAIAIVENDAGKVYRHLGGLYRVLVQ